jgi:hypothetical protein
MRLSTWKPVIIPVFTALFLFLSAGKAEAAVARVQHTSKDAGTTTSSTLAFASNNTGGTGLALSSVSERQTRPSRSRIPRETPIRKRFSLTIREAATTLGFSTPKTLPLARTRLL